MLIADGPVPVFPTPVAHRGHCTGKPAFGRDLLRDRPQTWVRPRKSKLVPSVSGWRAPSVICGRKSTRRVLSGWSVSPNRARRFPRTASTRLASTILSNAMIAVGEPGKGAFPFEARPHLGLEPFVQHIVQKDVREAGRDHAP